MRNARRWRPAARESCAGLRRRLQPPLLLLAGVSFLASAIDSCLSQWGAIYLSSLSGGDTASGTLVYPVMMSAKIILLVRLGQIVRRVGWSAALYASLGLTAIAVLVAMATRTPSVALMGFALIGAGTAVLGPLVNTGAGERPGLTAGEARTVLELGEIPAYVLLPAIVGSLSSHLGVGPTIGITITSAVLGCAVLGRAIQPSRWLPR